jgi:DNA polymerase
MSDLFLDWETRSEVDLGDAGLAVYLKHPSTKIIMANYAFGDKKVIRWEPHLKPKLPSDLEDALHDPFCVAHAWGAEFERNTTLELLGIDKPTTEWVCTMSAARYIGLPGRLHDAGEVLGLGDKAKLRTGGGKTGKGSALVVLFSVPTDPGGKETLFGISPALFNEPWTHPKEWQQFCEYGGYDIISLREAEKKIRKFWPSEEEWETWRLDQKINSTGWPTDQLLIEGAKAIVLKEKAPLLDRIKELTGVSNPNSRDQILEWLEGQGFAFSSLGKDFVTRALAGECNLTPQAKEVLDLRTQTAKSSMSKYTALADMTCADGRLRHQYTYCGAHTHRWAAHGVNVGNLFKATKEVEKKLPLAIEFVQKMDYEAIKREFGKPLEVAASVQRSAFRAPAGMKFVVADLNAIENRGLGYLARCEAINKVFREKFVYEGKEYPLDPYLQFAVQMYGMSYHDLWVEYEINKDKTKRTICKAPVLGGGYQLGPGEEKIDPKTGLSYFTGLMGYARKMGIELSQEDSIKSIQTLRKAWKEVKWLWKDIEQAAAFAIRHPGTDVGVGVPQTKRDEEYFAELGRKINDPLISFHCHGERVLEMKLPSRASMYYWSPRVAKESKTWLKPDGSVRQYESDSIYYKQKDQKTKQWVETDTFGGHLVENADQSICRDVLVNGMKLADKIGFEVVGHCYDEVVCLTSVNSGIGVEDLCKCLVSPTSWGGNDFVLGAEGFESDVYRK